MFQFAERRKDVFDALDALAAQYDLDLRRDLLPGHVATVRADLAARMVNDPLVQQWLEVQRTTKTPRITRPWMALGEQRSWVLVMASEVKAVEVMLEDGTTTPLDDVGRAGMAAGLLMAQTYLWSTSVFDAIKACPMPEHVVSRDVLPFPFTYHTTEVPYTITSPDHPAVQGVTDWIHIGDVPAQNRCDITMPCTQEDGKGSVLLTRGSLPYGDTFPRDYQESERPHVNMILSMCAFLASPYAVVTHQPLPRAWRKHGGVAAPDTARTVAVVELRRAAKDALAAYDAESPEWKHRWWVCGHFRKQWHPSTQSHQVIWIAPHLKGPEDAPVLNKVYAVRR